MSAHHHSKVEHFLIHAVALLFTFSAIAASFLGYSVYQTDNYSTNMSTIAQPVHAQDPGWYFWEQISWTGGVSSSNFTIPWALAGGPGGSGGWNKYTSASNVVINSSGVRDDGSGNGELISTIFDVGTEKVGGAVPSDGGINSHTQIRGGSTITEVQSSAWSPLAYEGCLIDPFKHKYVQYKLINITPGQYANSVTFMSAIPVIDLTVKDASTGNPISNVDVTVSNSRYLVSDNGNGSYQVIVEYENIASYQLNISAPGYQTTTKSIDINSYKLGECLFVSYNTAVNLTPSSGEASTPSTPSSSTSSNSVNVGTGNSASVPFDSTTVPLSEFQQVTLPTQFTTSGSKTTALSKITDHTKVTNFTLDVPGKNKIVFKDTLDLSAKSTVEALKELGKYVKITSVGTVEIDSKAMPALNKKATITMSGLSFISTPQILINGKVDSEGIVNSVIYDSTTGVLIFTIDHFSKFDAVPKIELLKPSLTTVTDPDVNFRFRISDPKAKVYGSFNSVKLADMTPDPKTGEFTVKKLAFETGDNILKLTAESKLGKVPTFALRIKYDPKISETVPLDTNSLFLDTQVLYVGLSAIVFALLLGFLLYRKRRRLERFFESFTEKQTPPNDYQDPTSGSGSGSSTQT